MPGKKRSLSALDAITIFGDLPTPEEHIKLSPKESEDMKRRDRINNKAKRNIKKYQEENPPLTNFERRQAAVDKEINTDREFAEKVSVISTNFGKGHGTKKKKKKKTAKRRKRSSGSSRRRKKKRRRTAK